MTKKTAVILLGVNGTLSTAVINEIRRNHADDVVMFGFDVQPSSELLPATNYQKCDLRKRADIRRALDAIPYGSYSDLRLIICSAVMSPPTFQTSRFDEKTFYESSQINLIGQVHFATDFAMRCVNAGAKARVVLIGSTAAYVGSRDVGYSMSKSALDGVARSLSKNLATKGVTAIALHTGIFESNMEATVSDERKAFTVQNTHVKRKGTIDEICNFVCYYLLEAPEFATSMCVDINGGQHS
jgi:NAD(P)-dependent dehydrogenase (short-subunit alcohol dehydrogenase family)